MIYKTIIRVKFIGGISLEYIYKEHDSKYYREMFLVADNDRHLLIDEKIRAEQYQTDIDTLTDGCKLVDKTITTTEVCITYERRGK